VNLFAVLSRRRQPRFSDRWRNCRGAPRYSTSIFIHEERVPRRSVIWKGAASGERFFCRASVPVTVQWPLRRSIRIALSGSPTPTCGQPTLRGWIRTGLNDGAIGIGELKYPVQVDGPQMRRVYDIAGELRVPVLIHFEEGGFNSGIGRLPDLLKSYPKTTFIGHAQSWWSNISADVANESGYPTGRVRPGGLTDKLLTDYPNIYGDLSANSRRNALARDPDFATAFLSRHSKKLIFDSDCPCRKWNGRGSGIDVAGSQGQVHCPRDSHPAEEADAPRPL
jgi:hypothetical protein